MKLTFKKIITEFYSIRFWMAVMVITMLCFCANVEGESATSDTIIYNLIFHCSNQDFLAMGEQYSSYGVIMAFRNNYWFPIIVPIVSAIPYINCFYDEWLTGYYYIRMHRSKRVSYAVETVFMAAITGFLVMCFGVLFFGIICTYIFPSYSSYMPDPDGSIITAIYGQTLVSRFFTFVKVLLHVGMLGSIASVISLILLTIVQDSFLSLTLPMMLVYLSTKICNGYNLFIRQQYADNPPVKIKLLSLLIPSMYMNMEGVFYQWFKVPDILWHGYLLAIIGFMTVILIYIVKRRDA